MNITDARRASWLFRTTEIDAHFEAILDDAAAARVHAGGREVPGAFDALRDGGVVFRPTANPSASPGSGAPVRVEYERWGDAFAFYSRIAAFTPGGGWLIERPCTIERTELRRTPRVSAAALGFTCFEVIDHPGSPRLPLEDLSAGGLSVIVDIRAPPPTVGERATGFLHLEGQPPLPVIALVRHYRRRDEETRLIGMEIVGVAASDRARLVEWIARPTVH